MLLLILVASVTWTAAGETLGVLKSTPATHSSSGWTANYPVLSLTGGTLVGSHAWRVANGTGNCCENHVTGMPSGRLIDIGGNYPIYSDDAGFTWKRVSAPGATIGGEGSGAVAPTGDYVGMVWDPYTGDRVITYKWNASENQWYTSTTALHGPFYDRPWIGVVPGPITVGAVQLPYVVLMIGGTPETTTYVSYDGLNYAHLSTLEAEALLANRTGYLDQPSLSWADWVQPTSHARVYPLASGGAVVMTLNPLCRTGFYETDLTSSCFRAPAGWRPSPNALLRVDSLGRIHAFDRYREGFYHNVSADGGRNWTSSYYTPPPGHGILSWDAVANGALDAAAVAIRTTKFSGTQVSGTYVWKITNLSTGSPTARLFQVGKADRLFGSGILSNTARMDFITVAMMPDGRVATSFGDSQHSSPRVAVQRTP